MSIKTFKKSGIGINVQTMNFANRYIKLDTLKLKEDGYLKFGIRKNSFSFISKDAKDSFAFGGDNLDASSYIFRADNRWILLNYVDKLYLDVSQQEPFTSVYEFISKIGREGASYHWSNDNNLGDSKNRFVCNNIYISHMSTRFEQAEQELRKCEKENVVFKLSSFSFKPLFTAIKTMCKEL